MRILSQIKARLREEPPEQLPRLLKLYAGDTDAIKLIQQEIQHRQQMAAIHSKVQPYRK